MMQQSYFIAGTDTGVGKTYTTCQLIRHYVAQGYKTVGMKAVAAGCETIDGVWQNEDVAKLRAASNVDAPLDWINPYCFDEPIAPHIAADIHQVEIKLEKIIHAYQQLQQVADVVIVEGSGGLLVPIDATRTMADVMVALNAPAILVVDIKLGCINHTLLTAEALKARQIRLGGWVANKIKLYEYAAENIAAISERLGLAPMALAT